MLKNGIRQWAWILPRVDSNKVDVLHYTTYMFFFFFEDLYFAWVFFLSQDFLHLLFYKLKKYTFIHYFESYTAKLTVQWSKINNFWLDLKRIFSLYQQCCGTMDLYFECLSDMYIYSQLKQVLASNTWVNHKQVRDKLGVKCVLLVYY